MHKIKIRSYWLDGTVKIEVTQPDGSSRMQFLDFYSYDVREAVRAGRLPPPGDFQRNVYALVALFEALGPVTHEVLT